MPSGLPTTSPSATASATGSRRSPTTPPPSATPALASANSGMMTKADPRVQRVLEPLQRRDRFAGGELDSRCASSALDLVAPASRSTGVDQSTSRASAVDQRARRRQQAEQHAGDGRVDAGLEDASQTPTPTTT